MQGIDSQLERDTKLILSIFASVASAILIMLIIAAMGLFPLDVTVKPQDLLAQSNLNAVHPEPLERGLFLVTTAIIPFLLGLFYLLAGKITASMAQERLKYLNRILWCLVIVVGIVLWWFGMFFLNDGFTALRGFWRTPSGLLAVIAGTVVSYLICSYYRSIPYVSAAEKLIYNILMFLCIISIGAVPLFGMLSENLLPHYFGHFNTVFHAIVQVYFGKGILVDFPHQYGLYPHFLVPFFELIGLSVFSFTLVMGLLTALAFTALFFVLKKVVSNRLVACMGFLTLIYFGYLFGREMSWEAYFQYHPIRFFFPAVFVYIVWRYLTVGDRFIYFSGFVLASVSMLWNFDTGFVVYISWLLLLLYRELTNRNYKAAAKHIGIAIVVLLTVVAGFSLYMKVRYNGFPDFLSFLSYQKIFYQLGFYMQPMPVLHPWNFIALAYVSGLAYSISLLIKGSMTSKGGFVFFLSVLGVGIFTYYQGRSVSPNLAYISYPAILLLSIFADSLVDKVRNGCGFEPKYVLSLIVFFMSYTHTQLVMDLPMVYKVIAGNVDYAINPKNNSLTRDFWFLRKNISNHNKVMMLTYYSGLYHLVTKSETPLSLPGPQELLLAEDYKQIFKYLLVNRDVPVVIDKYFAESDDAKIYGILDALSHLYRQVAVSPDGDMRIYVRL